MIDAFLDVRDRGGQSGHRTVDIGAGAVDGVQQRTGLAQRRLGGANGVDQTGLAPGWARHKGAAVGDVLVGESQPLLGGFGVACHRSQRRIGELLVQSRQRLLRWADPRRQIDHLLGQSRPAGTGR